MTLERLSSALLLVSLWPCTGAVAGITSPVINTVAGNGTAGFTASGTATSAALGAASSVAVDLAGNFYFADPEANRVQMVTPSGVLSTIVAGAGIKGYSGDNGHAYTAQLNGPSGLAVFSGNAGSAGLYLYIADQGNNVVRMVDLTTQIITTVAGVGPGPNGTPAMAGYTGDNGAANLAELNAPIGLAVDQNNNVFVADSGNHVIREFYIGGNISTVAGTGTQGSGADNIAPTSTTFCEPTGLAIDAGGGLYVADTCNQRVRRFYPSYPNLLITTVAGNGSAGFAGDGGAATAAKLSGPTGVAADSFGNIYIDDYGNERIRVVAPGGNIQTLAGGSTAGYNGDGIPANTALLNMVPGETLTITWAPGIAVDGWGSVYIADTHNRRIRAVQPSIATVAGNGMTGYGGDGVGATTTSLYSPRDIVVDPAGNLYIADLDNNRVRKVNTAGVISTIAGTGSAGYNGDGIPATSALLNGPQRLCLDAAGNLYIADNANNRVRMVNTSGIISTVAGGGTFPGSDGVGDGGPATAASLNSPFGLAVDLQGNLYIADSGNSRIRRVSAGNISTVAGTGTSGLGTPSGSATNMAIAGAQGIAVDPGGNLYIADTNNNRILEVSGYNGNAILIAGSTTGAAGFTGDFGYARFATLNSPRSVALDPFVDLYIGDEGNSRVREITAIYATGGVIKTVAGNGTAAYSGDAGAATAASLSAPRGAFIDTSGNLYVADTANNRIRVLSGVAAAAATVSASSLTATPGQMVTLAVSSNVVGPASYEWYEGTSGNTSTPLTFDLLSGANSPTPTVLITSVPESFWVSIAGANGEQYSETITINAPSGGGSPVGGGSGTNVPLPLWAQAGLALGLWAGVQRARRRP